MSTPNLATKQLNALHGWKWIADGFAVFRRSPVIWIALLFIYLLIGMLLSTVKLIGPIVLGMRKQVNVLQQGASVDAIVHMTAITVARAIRREALEKGGSNRP